MRSDPVSILKTVIISCFALSAGVKATAQKYTVQETYLAGIRADSFAVAGLTSLIEFTLKQDEKLFTDGTLAIKAAQNTLKDKVKNGVAASDALATLDAYSIQAQQSGLSVYLMLFGDNSFKTQIMDEKAEDRKKKVEWKDQEYKLTSDSKSKFKQLNEYLESQQDGMEKEKALYDKLYKK